MMATFPPSVPAIFARAFPSQKMSSTQVGLRFAEFGITINSNFVNKRYKSQT